MSTHECPIFQVKLEKHPDADIFKGFPKETRKSVWDAYFKVCKN